MALGDLTGASTTMSPANLKRNSITRVTGLASEVDEGRFPPGTLVAERYRVIGLLGKGGMGEVYRANDLVLGQQVALKFLPETLGRNQSMIARFYSEVRIARQVSHPNVCRVYDIGETEGLLYLSMEYVNGEDLGSLLRRIGRLPSDKAAEIARKLCAGLAAAHEKGILHRDLKPANIMLDGSGQIYIMDFGLAGLASNMTGAEIRNGTPAYMAPEQLAGREVSIRSDIYALGLVLYEIFTGKRPFEASSLAELMRMQESGTPTSISDVVSDLDPAVERIINRCLAPNPKDRPASALLVAGALPGGDPIAAALAAGETPTPQLIASSGSADGLSSRSATLCLAAVLAGLAILAAFGSYINRPITADLDYPPEVLVHKAAEISRKLGYARPANTVSAFTLNSEYRDYARKRGIIEPLHAHGPNQSLQFWVRESMTPVYTDSFSDVDYNLPAFDKPGMRRILLDPEGDLIAFEAVPDSFLEDSARDQANFDVLFEASGLASSTKVEAKPLLRPSVPYDQLRAWWAGYGEANKEVLVEAASWRGKPVWFRITPSWNLPKPGVQASTGVQVADVVNLVVFFAIVAGAIGLAWHNARNSKADRNGAKRLAQGGFAISFTGYICAAVHDAGAGESVVLQFGVAISLLIGALLYLLYFSLEPWVRRLWPQSLITWSRVMTGHPRDAKVGADVLVGTLWGVGWSLLFMQHSAWFLSQGWFQGTRFQAYSLGGGRHLVEGISASLIGTLQLSFVLFFAIMILRALLRREWLAGVAFALLFGSNGFLSAHPAVDVPYNILINGLFVFMLIRFGLLCSIVAYFCFSLVVAYPVCFDLSAWYATAGLFPLFVVAGIAIYGFRTTLGGRSILGAEIRS